MQLISDNTTPTNVTVALVGSAGTGKTSYLNRLLGLEFDPKYTPADLCYQKSIRRVTNNGPVRFNMVDIPVCHLQAITMFNPDAVIVFADPSRTDAVHIDNFMDQTPKCIYKLICCSFDDERTWPAFDASHKGRKVFRISSRENINLDAPLLDILQSTIFKSSNVAFTDVAASKSNTDEMRADILNIPATESNYVVTADGASNFRLTIGDYMITCTHRPREIEMYAAGKPVTIRF